MQTVRSAFRTRLYVLSAEKIDVGKEELPTVAVPAADLTPSSSPSPTSKKTSYHRRLAALALLLPLAFFLSFPRDLLPRSEGCHHRSKHVVVPRCPGQPAPHSVGQDWNPVGDEEYKKLAVQRFSGAIQVPTESYDDFGTPDDDPRIDKFADLHKYLESTFPRVYSTLQVEKIQKYGILMTWKAEKKDETSKSRKPIVLMAHQDVVPVNPGTIDEWTHPPFSGEIDDEGYVWGRGSADCKNTLIGILAALDKLVEEGFQPERDIIFSSGFDEEISGWRSAKYLAEAIEQRYGKDGVAFVLDEGFGGITPIYDRTFALFAVAEKGAVSLKLDVATPGGHASMPDEHTSIGVLAELIHNLEKHPDQPKLRPTSPKLAELQCYAEYGNVDKHWKKRLQSPKQWPKLARELSRDVTSRSTLMTTQAVDLISGGVKINALPESASASINYRIEFSSSVEATTSRIRSVLEPVVQGLNLTFDAYGSHADVKNNVVHLSVVEDSEIEPAPLTPTEGSAWDLIAGTTRHIWQDAIATPTGMMANTDTKYSWNLTSSIYRFVPGRIDQIKGFHTVNERTHIDAHLSGIRFFYKLIRNTEGWEAE
ncbi:hypothetical protein JCM3774_002494 [Rhodotorula dairenensis]